MTFSLILCKMTAMFHSSSEEKRSNFSDAVLNLKFAHGHQRGTVVQSSKDLV